MYPCAHLLERQTRGPSGARASHHVFARPSCVSVLAARLLRGDLFSAPSHGICDGLGFKSITPVVSVFGTLWKCPREARVGLLAWRLRRRAHAQPRGCLLPGTDVQGPQTQRTSPRVRVPRHTRGSRRIGQATGRNPAGGGAETLFGRLKVMRRSMRSQGRRCKSVWNPRLRGGRGGDPTHTSGCL